MQNYCRRYHIRYGLGSQCFCIIFFYLKLKILTDAHPRYGLFYTDLNKLLLQILKKQVYFKSKLDEKEDQIDRFDVRAHLDVIPEKKKHDQNFEKDFDKDELSEVMYERYREIIHNDFKGIDQKQVLNVSKKLWWYIENPA
jgi:hypothetical protein